MRQGEIIIFRYRGAIHIGRVQHTDAKKIKATTGQNRVFEVPADRVLYTTGMDATDEDTVERFRQHVEQQAGTIDLRDVWEILKEDDGAGYPFQDIAELYWGNEVSIEQYGATLLALARGCPYFQEQNSVFVPFTDERVEENLTRIVREEANRTEREAFIQWMVSPEKAVPASFSNRQRHWLNRIMQYAMLGEEYDQREQAKALLTEIRGETTRGLKRYAFDLMVEKGIWDEDEHLDLIIHHVPTEFDDEVMQQARMLKLPDEDREDLTHLMVFSIDDAETRDVDDAISVETTEEGYRIGVHIADVSAAIPKHSPLDRAARARTTSLYFPDRHIPMLPSELSYAQCSLLQNQRRHAVSYLYEVSREFALLRTAIVPSIIVSRAKLSYREVDEILQTMDHPLAETLKILNEAVDVFYAQRMENGAIEVDRTELYISVDADKRISIATRTGQSRAEHIVSELMILTNVAAARYLRDHTVPSIYRTQDEPDLTGVKEAPHEVVRRYLILRQLKPMSLSLEPKPHAILGVDAYCQMTSPIRRYIDLVLQRQLTCHQRTGQPCYTREELQDEISHIEGSKEIQRITARRAWYWLLKYLASIGDRPLKAVVLEVRERDVLVELLDFGVRVTMRLTAQAAAGHEIAVRVTQADPWDGTLRLVQVAKNNGREP